MSDIVEKTLFSIHNLIVGNSKRDFACSGLQSLVETMTSVTSKREQDLVIQKEIASMQQKLGQPDLKPHYVKDCLVRAVYCEILGYPVPFVYIHAIKQAQHGSLANKRIGYLAATIFLHEHHELVILLINTIQKDLKSTNILENCMALTAATYLVSAELAPAIVDLIEEKLKHPKEIVRKKAILTLHHFLLGCPSSVKHLIPRLKACIGDPDPDVVSAAIHFLQSLVVTDASSCKDIVVPLVQVLGQVLQRKLPIDFDYHGLPGPWIQIDILRLFSIIGHRDEVLSDLMYASLKDVLLRVDVNHTIGYAVLYECVSTSAHIHPNDALLEMASSVIGKFLQSSNSDMKYMGLKALNQMIQNVHPSLATQHQSVVMSCLRHPDESVRAKTLDLLFCLTTSSNIQAVCPKIMDHLTLSNDEYAKTRIIHNILDLISQHSLDPKWSFQTINSLLVISTPVSLLQVIVAIRTLLQKGDNDANGIKEVCILAVETYYNCLKQREITKDRNAVVHLAITVVRDYYPMCSSITSDNVFQLFSNLLQSYLNEDDILASLLMALKKIVIHNPIEVGDLQNQLQGCLRSLHPLVRQQACELCQVLRNYEKLKSLFHNDNASKEEDIDWTLSFLDTYICNSSTSSPYKPYALRKKKDATFDMQFVGSSIHQYNVLSDPSIVSTRQGPASLSSVSTYSESAAVHSQHGFSIKLPQDKVRRVWHKEGCNFTSLRNENSTSCEKSEQVIEETRHLACSSANSNVDDDFANLLFGSLEVSHVPAAPTINALDSNSSTSSIQRISSDSGPSSNQDSPLDSLSHALVVKLDMKPPFAMESSSPPFTLILKDDCSSEESEITPSNSASTNTLSNR